MYPVLKPGVSLGTFCYRGSDDPHFYIENSAGEMFEVSQRLYNALLEADGTKPLNLPENGKRVLPKLKQNGLVQTSRIIKSSWATYRFVLLFFGSINRRIIRICKAINSVLPAATFLVFVMGIVAKIVDRRFTPSGFCLPLYCSLVFLSIFLHEVGHLVAGLAGGYKVTDAGILLLWRIPIGAYVAHEGNKRASKGRRLQFALAGVEMNIGAAGLFLGASTILGRLSFTLTMAAAMNVLLAIINLIPSRGFDGEAALSAMLGVDSIFLLSKKWVCSRKYRRKLLKAGLPGLLCFGFLSAILLSRLLIWLVMGVDLILAIIGVVLL